MHKKIIIIKLKISIADRIAQIQTSTVRQDFNSTKDFIPFSSRGEQPLQIFFG
jgi:hypothetical protein